MRVKRIVANLPAKDPARSSAFYQQLLGLDVLMQMDFIQTLGANTDAARPQISVASEGGGGQPVPAISVEVDDLDAVIARAGDIGASITYGPVDEPWGVRRIMLRDPDDTLINILSHSKG
jgi:lactoylglutathione lyase